MALKASRESCFKPVYSSELCLHVGSALQCLPAICPQQAGAVRVTHQPPPLSVWWVTRNWCPSTCPCATCLGHKKLMAPNLPMCHLPGCPGAASSLPCVQECSCLPWQGGLPTPAPGAALSPPRCHTLALPLSLWWPCPSRASDVAVAGFLRNWLWQQENSCRVPAFHTVFGARPRLCVVWQSGPMAAQQNAQLSNISVPCRSHQQQFEQLPEACVLPTGTFCVTWAPPPSRGLCPSCRDFLWWPGCTGGEAWGGCSPGLLHHLFLGFNSCT